MLRKLMKYELLQSLRIIGALLFCILGSTLLARFSVLTLENFKVPELFIQLLLIIYTFLLVALTVGIFLYLGCRFYANLFGNEGYLSHTLPVPTWMLLISKLCVHFFWTVLAYGLLLSCLVLCSLFLKDDLSELPSYFGDAHSFIGILIGIWLTSALATLTMMYAALSLGSLFNRHRILYSLGFFALLYGILQIVACIVLVLFLKDDLAVAISGTGTVMPSVLNRIFPIMMVLDSIAALVMLFITYYILTKKRNLI